MNKGEEQDKKEVLKMYFITLTLLFFGSGVIVFFSIGRDIKLSLLLAVFTSVMYSLLMYFDYKNT